MRWIANPFWIGSIPILASKKKNLTLINKFCILRKMEKIMSNKEYQKSVWYKIERLFDRHNHLMEFIRTLFALITITLQLVILSRLV
jgi:hypothetical protein